MLGINQHISKYVIELMTTCNMQRFGILKENNVRLTSRLIGNKYVRDTNSFK